MTLTAIGSQALLSKVATPPPSGKTSTISFGGVQVGTLTFGAIAYPNANGSGTPLAHAEIAASNRDQLCTVIFESCNNSANPADLMFKCALAGREFEV